MGRRIAFAAAAAIGAAALWWRKNPSACPYSQRFWVEAPHPLITRSRLRSVLRPFPGERICEIGPGAGYYTPSLAAWVGDAGRIDIYDLEPRFLDHALGRVAKAGLRNVVATQGDATTLPYEDDSLDAVVLTAVLGEIPDQTGALSEIARVLRPGGRLVVGELLGDPHYVAPSALEARALAAGLVATERSGPAIGYFARLEPVG